MRYFIVSYYGQANGKYNESAKLDDKIRNKDMQFASLILDYKERKIVKCRFEGELGKVNDFDVISNFYKTHYTNIISQVEAKYQVLEDAKKVYLSGLTADATEEVTEPEETEETNDAS